MHKSKSPPRVTLLIAVLTLFALGATSLWAEDVFVTGYAGTVSGTDITACPPSCHPAAGSGISGSGASAASASLASPSPGGARRVIYGNTTAAYWSVTPTDLTYGAFTFTKLQNLGVYKIYVTDGESGNASPDLIVNMTATGGDLADASGVAGTSIPLTAFRSTAPDDVWIHVGYITNTVYDPTVTFTYASGTIASTGGRWYMDAVRFEYQDPCTGVAPQAGIGGPLGAGQTFVNVAGVAAGATNITVYANGVKIGETNSPTLFAAGTHAVATSALIKGDLVNATQSKFNSLGGLCTSAVGPGVAVGGGPNPSIRAFLACWRNSTNAGPIGANSDAPPGAGATFQPYILKTAAMSFGAAPAPGQQLAAGTCWQTVTFQHGVDTAYELNTATAMNNTDNYCSLESLMFAMDAADSGPYDIYIDSIMNGTNVVEDFEGYAVGTVQTFVAPNAAPLPSAAGYYFPGAPNSSLVSGNNRYDGTNSCRIQWQWADNSGIRWARVMANASSGKHLPQLDTTKPIIVSYLVLPVGATTGSKFNGTVGPITNTTPVYDGSSVTLGVTVTGSGSYTYQWVADGADVGGATDRTYTDPVLPWDDNGVQVTRTYNVKVSDGSCTLSALPVTLAPMLPVPIITNQPVSTVVNVGSPASICVGATNAPVAGDVIFNYTWEKVDDTGTNWSAVGGSGTATCLSDVFPAAQFTETGFYRVVIAGSYGSVTSSVASLQVVAADVVIGNGVGLRGNYYNQPNFTGGAVPESWGTPDLSRLDPTVAFDWVTGSPDPAIQAEYFTARWYGQIQPLFSGSYEFTVRSDDGCRLWIDKQLVVNSWIPQGATDRTGTITLDTAKHDILLEYFEQGGNASAQLYWTNAGNISKTYVPKQQLFANMAAWTPPVVTLAAPADGSSVTLPAQVSLAANVVTNDGIVKAVEFYNGSILITTVTNPPYSASWSAAQGSYPVSAKVVYNESSKEVSSTNAVTVNAVTKASVTIDSIVNNGNGTVTINYSGGAGASFTLLKSAVVPNPTRDTWTPVGADNPGSPGSFTTTPAGNEFYTIRSN